MAVCQSKDQAFDLAGVQQFLFELLEDGALASLPADAREQLQKDVSRSRALLACCCCLRPVTAAWPSVWLVSSVLLRCAAELCECLPSLRFVSLYCLASVLMVNASIVATGALAGGRLCADVAGPVLPAAQPEDRAGIVA